MSDIKNLFVDTFAGFDFSQFAESDLKRLGFKTKEVEPSKKQLNKKCCPRKKKTEIEKLFNRNKIIPIPPPLEPVKRFKYNHIKLNSIKDEYEANKARHKLYYHTHREEMKWKRLVREGRTDVIELLLMGSAD